MQLQVIITVAAKAKVIASYIQTYALVKSLDYVNRKHVRAYSKLKRHRLLHPVKSLRVLTKCIDIITRYSHLYAPEIVQARKMVVGEKTFHATKLLDARVDSNEN